MTRNRNRRNRIQNSVYYVSDRVLRSVFIIAGKISGRRKFPVRHLFLHIMVAFSCQILVSCGVPAFNEEKAANAPEYIRIATYNVKDMFDEIDDPHKTDGPPIEPDRLQALAEVIMAVDADILALQEVENLEFLQEFNEEYLGAGYPEVALIEGNDPRGIDVAVLSKIAILDVVSYKDRRIPDPVSGGTIQFSRDLVAVRFPGPGNSIWTLLTTHLKSGVEPESVERRTLQAEEIAEICREDGYVSQYGRGFVILAGDLNAEPWSDDLEALSGVPFSDPARDLPFRRTHAGGKVLDYILLSPDADSRYMVGSVTIYTEPPSRDASDHFPVYLDLYF
jgi:endonuclease/exonuclease/phosphatase family metal-dependent hydrolase